MSRDSEWKWHQLGHMQVCTSLQTDNHASTPPLSFLQAGCPTCCPTNSVKALKAKLKYTPGKTLRKFTHGSMQTARTCRLMSSASAEFRRRVPCERAPPVPPLAEHTATWPTNNRVRFQTTPQHGISYCTNSTTTQHR